MQVDSRSSLIKLKIPILTTSSCNENHTNCNDIPKAKKISFAKGAALALTVLSGVAGTPYILNAGTNNNIDSCGTSSKVCMETHTIPEQQNIVDLIIPPVQYPDTDIPEEKDFLNAARLGNAEKVESYLNNGMDPNTKDKFCRTALTFATIFKRKEIVQTLLQHKANPYVQDWYTWHPRRYAAAQGDYEITKIYLEHDDSNINEKNGFGWSDMMFTAAGGNLKTMKLFKEHSGNIHDTDRFGKTLVDIAEQYGNKDMANYLKENGVK